MRTNTKFTVESERPPTVEIDFEAGAAYVRFKKAKVAKTVVTRTVGGMHLAVDLDANGVVIGVESIGFTNFSLNKVVHAAKVDPRGIDFSKTVFRAPQSHSLAALTV